MSSKQNIKETIKVLCDVINYHGRNKLTPETLRLAKYNKNEATEPMWRLLFETNWFMHEGLMDNLPQLSHEDMVLYVKHELYMKGYYAMDFHTLPGDMSYGSREVLLAYGWFISHGKLIWILIDNCDTMLQECFPVCKESATKCEQDIPKETSEELPSMGTLLWLLGHFRLQCNGLYCAQSKLASLVSKVHCATRNSQLSKGHKQHLSVLEVFLLRHPKELAKFQEKLEQYNSYLENLLRFVEQQTVFWKWLKSVNEAKLVETASNDVLGNVRELTLRCCVVCKDKASKEQQRIAKIYSEIQDCLGTGELLYKQACEKLQRAGYSVDRDIKNSELVKLNEHISSLSISDEHQHTTAAQAPFPELRRLQENSDCPRKKSEPIISSAKQTIIWLREQIAQLDIELMENKNLHLKMLNDLAVTMQELVCIPPIESSKYLELRNT